jgi:hypothetical protein
VQHAKVNEHGRAQEAPPLPILRGWAEIRTPSQLNAGGRVPQTRTLTEHGQEYQHIDHQQHMRQRRARRAALHQISQTDR